MGGFVLQEAVGGIFALVVYAVVFTGVYKIFKIAKELEEMKTMLLEIQRNTQDHLNPISTRPIGAGTQPAEDLLRALQAQNYPLDHPSDDFAPPPAAGLGDSAR